ncbi:MAG: iron-sulfur cluster carrier protein [Candidatus Binatia bacterium]|nr:MAG: iron-sulfur cluster carrier protein [Candidatus Binatia bacterium]
MTRPEDVRERLTEIRPPRSDRDIVTAGMVRRVEVREGEVVVALDPKGLPEPLVRVLVADVERAVGALEGVARVSVAVEPEKGLPAPEPVPGVRDVLAVASAKGGVGKSTVATNLAVALRHRGKTVGLLDADVYGPSLPVLFGLEGRPRVTQSKKILPLEKYGVRAMSMGFFLDDRSPVIWRGPLVMGLVRQFLRDVDWSGCEILVVDLPPGTGDAALTLLQQVPVTGGLVVTTPQDVALLDVERGVSMFEQVRTPVIGVVENMSEYVCPRCGTREPLFGEGGGRKVAERFGVPLLARIPLDPSVREAGDAGKPVVVDRPDHPVSKVFEELAERVLEGMEAAREPAPVLVG